MLLGVSPQFSRGRWITGADFLIDGGTTASYFYGDLQYLKATH